jgi:hypothetical protein
MPNCANLLNDLALHCHNPFSYNVLFDSGIIGLTEELQLNYENGLADVAFSYIVL